MTAADVLRRHLRAGDHIWVEEACGEPTGLVDALCDVASSVPDLTVYVGWSLRRTPLVDAPVRLRALMGVGRRGGDGLEYLPVRYSSIPGLIRSGALRVDVVLAQVGAERVPGGHPLSVQAGWMPVVLERARTVVAERNAALPTIRGFPAVSDDRVDAFVDADRAPLSYFVDRDRAPAAIGAHAADQIPQGATLEFGPGPAVSRAVNELARRRHPLRLWSGLLTDDLVALDRAGCLDPDSSITATMLCGGPTLLSFAATDRRVRGLPLEQSHDLGGLLREPRFVALNSAHSVDLTGAIDTEDIAAGVTGGLGGHGDFSLVASQSSNGRSIVTLPAVRAGESTIRARVTGSTPRCDVDVVVTEHGAAVLTGKTLGERAEALIAIAAPEHRSSLAAATGTAR